MKKRIIKTLIWPSCPGNKYLGALMGERGWKKFRKLKIGGGPNSDCKSPPQFNTLVNLQNKSAQCLVLGRRQIVWTLSIRSQKHWGSKCWNLSLVQGSISQIVECVPKGGAMQCWRARMILENKYTYNIFIDNSLIYSEWGLCYGATCSSNTSKWPQKINFRPLYLPLVQVGVGLMRVLSCYCN